MRPSTKGALLSGLLFPGMGQLTLGKKPMGWGIIVLTFLGVAGLTIGLGQRIPSMVQMVMRESESGVMTMARILEISLQTAATGNWWLERASLYLILLCWVFSVIHAIVVGQGSKSPASSGDTLP